MSCHPLQVRPDAVPVHAKPSMPRTEIWTPPDMLMPTGSDVTRPPAYCQPDQVDPSTRPNHSALSIPRTNTIVDVPEVAANGSDEAIPPSGRQPDHASLLDTRPW